MADVPIRWASGAADLAGALAVREQVFCVEQGVPPSEELDELDEQALHLIALDVDGTHVIGTLRLLALEGGVVKIGRVAVQREWRHRGIASQMLALALARARERGYEWARLASQVAATALYEQAGFAVEPGEPFDDAGIPHVWMSRRLTAG
jgi:predicted GNAT family N-acyltransferase